MINSGTGLCKLSQVFHMWFPMAACSWPIFMMMNTGTGLCKPMPYLRYGWPKWTWGLPWLPTVAMSQVCHMRFPMAACSWPIFMVMNTGTGLCKPMLYLRYVTWGVLWLPTVGLASWRWIQGLDCVNWCLTSGMSHEVCHGCLRLEYLHEDEYKDWAV